MSVWVVSPDYLCRWQSRYPYIVLGGYLHILGAPCVQSCFTLWISDSNRVVVYDRYSKSRLVCVWLSDLDFAMALLFHNTFPMIVFNNLNVVVLWYYKWRVKFIVGISVSIDRVSLLCNIVIVEIWSMWVFDFKLPMQLNVSVLLIANVDEVHV